MIRIALRLVLLAVIIGVVANVVAGIHVEGGFGSLLWIAALFSAVNLILGTLLRLLTLPLIIVTFGLFLLLINALLLAVTAGLSRDLNVDGFGAAVIGGFLIALGSWVVEMLLPVRRRTRD